jgi:hypothetical protein
LADEIGVRRWHYDLWYKILESALAGRPNQVDRSFHPSLSGPAFSRYGVTSPHQLRVFDRYNESRQNPAEHIWPFNFMYVLQAKSTSRSSTVWPPKRGRKPAPKKISPIAPFGQDFETSLCEAFDRETSDPIARDELKSYAEALADYHIRPESKFLNARAFDRGRTERRHIIASGIVHIGKEADQLEDRVIQDINDEAEVIYGADDSSEEHLRALLCEAVKVSSVNAVAAATGISRGHLTRVVRGAPLKTAVNTHKIILALSVGSIRPRPKAWRTTPDNPSSPRSATANTQPLHTKL